MFSNQKYDDQKPVTLKKPDVFVKKKLDVFETQKVLILFIYTTLQNINQYNHCGR